MKKLYFLLFVLLWMAGAKAQVQSDCTVLPVLLNYYDRDIKHLALCRMFQTHSPDTVLVTIPQEYIDTIAEGMAGIVNAIPAIPASDSVFNLYCVHNRHGCINESGYFVKVDKSYAWTDAWQNLQALTGDPLMDTIMVRYSLFVERFDCNSSGCYAKINSDNTWNSYALCDTLELVPGVIWADLSGMSGDDSYIGYNVISDERYFDFSFEWGDCMSGCGYHHIWKFKVSPACEVTFLGMETNYYFFSWGVEPFPDPINCNIFQSIKEINDTHFLSIYPNPSSTNITIESSSIPSQLSILNLNGQKLINRQITEPSAAIDISSLPGGVYFIKLKNEKTVEVRKIIKQ